MVKTANKKTTKNRWQPVKKQKKALKIEKIQFLNQSDCTISSFNFLLKRDNNDAYLQNLDAKTTALHFDVNFDVTIICYWSMGERKNIIRIVKIGNPLYPRIQKSKKDFNWK